MLFFGCRHPEQDFIYADELKAFAADGVAELHTAFSRAEGPKTYVQHLVAAQKDRVWELIDKGAIIYVCGDGGKMEPDVKATLMLDLSRAHAVPTPMPPRAGSRRWEPGTATCSTSGLAASLRQGAGHATSRRMIPWEKIDTARIPGTEDELRLMRRGREFSIMLGTNELMNSRLSGSEEALATLAAKKIEKVEAAAFPDRWPRHGVHAAGRAQGART